MTERFQKTLIILGVIALFIFALTDPVFFNFLFGWMV